PGVGPGADAPTDPAVGPRTGPHLGRPIDLHVGPRTGRVAGGGNGGSRLSTGGTNGDPGTNGAPLLLERVATNGFAGEGARALRAGVLVGADLRPARDLLD